MLDGCIGSTASKPASKKASKQAKPCKQAQQASKQSKQTQQEAHTDSAGGAEDHLRIARLQYIAILLPSEADHLRALSVVQV